MIGSLFSGYGGLDLATRRVFRAQLAFVSDIEPGPCRILAHHHPDVPNIGDVSEVDWSQWAGKVTVLTGGFPCQDVSAAGLRRGLIRGVTRSGLWGEMHRAITELRPKYVVIENVRGLLSAAADSDVEPCPWCLGDKPAGHLRALGAVLGDLADAGYDARWCGLRAADVGACHGRYRVFILAQPADPEGDSWRFGDRNDGDAANTDSYTVRVEPVGQPLGNNSPIHREAAVDAHGVHREGRPTAELARETRPTPRPDLTLLPTPTGSDANGTGVHGDGGCDLRTTVQRLLPTPRASDGSHGGPNQRGSSGDLALPAAVHHRFGEYAEAVYRHAKAVGRPSPDPTEPAPRGGRRLSPRFVEWLMFLTDGWVTDVPGLSRQQQLRALGNGVVPMQAEVAIRHMLTANHRFTSA